MKTDKFLNSIMAFVTVSLALISFSASADQPYAYARNTYTHGQHTEVAYEGWRPNADGTISLTFGYFNHNWEEELDIPVGENNFFSPGPVDRGQPSHFLPRRNRFTFDVIVPGDFGDKELVWEVTSPNGITRKAYGTLREDYKIDNIIIMSETGSLGAGSSDPEIRANIPPSVSLIGDEIRTVNVGEALHFQTRVSDDGIPKPFDPTARFRLLGGTGAASISPAIIRQKMMMTPPPKPTVAKNNGLYLSWNVYRGPDSVTGAMQDVVHFDPPQVKPWEDTRPSANSPWSWLWVPQPLPADGVVDVTVTFDEPGTYLLWGRADDGGLFTDKYLTVNVRP